MSNRNLVLILGNGFDLELGLPTRYADFLHYARFVSLAIDRDALTAEEYVRELERKGPTALTVLCKKAIEKITEHLESCLISKADSDEVERAVRVSFHEWAHFVDENMWLEYFWGREVDDKRWIDFESDIAAVIERVDRSRYYTTGKPVPMETELPYEVRRYLDTEGLANHLVAKASYKDFRDRALNDLNRLTEALSHYMCHDVESIELRPDIVTPFLLDVYDAVRDSNNAYVLDFNYTRTFERLYTVLMREKTNAKICHIHGEAEDENGREVVLGIDEYLTDDELQRNVDFVEFTKYYQRIAKETNSTFLSWLVELDRSSDTKIIIIGHSLGITDGDILAQFLNCKSVTAVDCYYHNEATRKQQISNLTAILGKNQTVRRMTGPSRDIRLISEKEPWRKEQNLMRS